MISIIIPVYNAARWLDDCLSSALAVPDAEVIAVNDASTDDSPALLRVRAKGEPRLKVVDLPANGGLSHARNAGLDHAQGRWIVFLDADDTLLPEETRRLVAAGDHDLRIGVLTPRGRRTPLALDAPEALRLLFYQRRGMFPSAWNKVYSRRLFDKERFRDGVWYEDLEIMPRLMLEADGILLTDICAYHYRDNPESFLHTWRPDRLDVLDVCDGNVRLMRRRLPALERAAKARRLSAAYNMLGLLLANGLPDHPAVTRCTQIIKETAPSASLDASAPLRLRAASAVSLLSMPLTRRLLAHQYRTKQ